MAPEGAMRARATRPSSEASQANRHWLVSSANTKPKFATSIGAPTGNKTATVSRN
jgi:hypothetical protein